MSRYPLFEAASVATANKYFVKIACFFSVFFLFVILIRPLFAETRSSIPWDSPKKVGETTVFFGENESAAHPELVEPQPGDKSYPWYLLEMGNNFLLAGHLEKAAAAFSKCYEVGGPTRVLSGFKLIEADEKLGRLDEALLALEDMKQKYLASAKEFGEANRIRAELEDKKRRAVPALKPSKLIGRLWLLQLSPQRMKYVLEAMEVLRTHGVPLKELAQKYAFRLDEYFIARPEQPADNPAEALAAVIYEADPEARVPIDRWRLNPDLLPNVQEIAPERNKKKFTGAEWTFLTHREKKNYVLGAMEVLKNQNVPMSKSAYAYEYVVDQLFTDKPELSAADSVVTLASILYKTEPEAREVLEAIRFDRTIQIELE